MAFVDYVDVGGSRYYVKDKNAIHMDEWLDIVYPVGSIYMNVNNIAPSTIFGGTWEKLEGKFLLGSSSEYELGSEGGSANSIVPIHNHVVSGSVVANGSHSHGSPSGWTFSIYKGSRSSESIGKISGTSWKISQVGNSGAWGGFNSTASAGSHDHSVNITSQNSGENGIGKNMPPYLVVNIWKRVEDQ